MIIEIVIKTMLAFGLNWCLLLRGAPWRQACFSSTSMAWHPQQQCCAKMPVGSTFLLPLAAVPASWAGRLLEYVNLSAVSADVPSRWYYEPSSPLGADASPTFDHVPFRRLMK